jgi:hypothetical protein
MTSALTFLELYHKDGDEFLNHIIRVTGDETWVSIVNAETKEQSKQWMYTHLQKKNEKVFKKVVCQKAGGHCFLGEERSADSGIHATRDHNNVRSVLRKAKKLHRDIRNKRRGMLTGGVVLLRESSRPHTSTAARSRALLKHFNW